MMPRHAPAIEMALMCLGHLPLLQKNDGNSGPYVGMPFAAAEGERVPRMAKIISHDDQGAPAQAASAVADHPAPKHEAGKNAGAALCKHGKQKTRRLINAITHEGPITTADLAASEGMSTKMVWGLLRYHLTAGTVRRIDDRWHAGIADPAVASAVRLLHKRGWRCLPPESEQMDLLRADHA